MQPASRAADCTILDGTVANMNFPLRTRRYLFSTLAALLALLPPGCLSSSAQILGPGYGSGSALSIPQSALMQPAVLAHMLTSGNKPLILQVGSRMLFNEAHIRGSEYSGPGSESEGLQSLHDRVTSLPRKKLIVLYCGCCPWTHCPNVSPAYSQLTAMGFTNVKVLYLPNNFGTDWVSKGYPVD